MKRLSSKGDSQNMFVDRLIQYRISPRPKTAEKHGAVFAQALRTDATDGPTDRPTDGWTTPLIEMRGRI